jgi:hypothetical protein
MKTIYSFITAMLLTANIIAQQLTPSVTAGESIQISKSDDFFFAGHDDENFYIIRTERERGDITGHYESFSRKDMKRITSRPLTVPTVDADEFNVLNIQYLKDRMMLFYSFISKSDKKRHICVTSFDKTGKTDEKFNDIIQCDKNDLYRVRIDTVAKKIIVITENIEMGNFGRNAYKVFNDDLSLVSESDDFKIDKKRYQIKKTQFDNKGNLYMFLRSSPANGYRPYFCFIEALTGKLSYHEVPKPRYAFGEDNGIFKDDAGNLYFAAKNLNGKGLFITAFKTGGLDNLKMQQIAFTANVPNEPEKKENLYLDFFISRVNGRPDGSTRVIMTRTYNEGAVWHSSWMVQLVLDRDLNLASTVFVPKFQHHQGGSLTYSRPHYEGQIYLFDKEHTWFIYNEHKSNLDKTRHKDFKWINSNAASSGEVVPVYCVVDDHAIVERKVLIDKKYNSYVTIRPDASYQVSEKEIICVIENADKLGFIKLNL